MWSSVLTVSRFIALVALVETRKLLLTTYPIDKVFGECAHHCCYKQPRQRQCYNLKPCKSDVTVPAHLTLSHNRPATLVFCKLYSRPTDDIAAVVYDLSSAIQVEIFR